MAGEARLLGGGLHPLTAQYNGEDDTAFVWAKVTDASGVNAKDVVGLRMFMDADKDGNPAQWSASKTLTRGDAINPVGVVAQGGPQNEYVPVTIYGPVSDVTLPAAITTTSTNSALLRGGSRLALTTGFAAGAPEHENAIAAVTDSKTGAQTVRDLFLFGRWYHRDFLYRSVGQFHHEARTDDLPTQSVLIDTDGRGWIEVDASEGVVGGQLVMCRRGRTGTWKVTHGTGGALADQVADQIFIMGIPEHDVAATAGAKVRLQVLGPVAEADMRSSVAVTAQAPALYINGSSGVTAGGAVHYRTFAMAATTGAGRVRPIRLIGRIIST